MKEYILLFRGAVHDDQELSAEVLEKKSQAWGEWISSLQETGGFVGGTGFHDEVLALRTSEGEFVEDELSPGDGLAGYVRVKVTDLDQLRSLCSQYPDWDLGGWIEVRPVSSQ